jgi:hypothetical protein
MEMSRMAEPATVEKPSKGKTETRKRKGALIASCEFRQA